jgi:hypothetical protein
MRVEQRAGRDEWSGERERVSREKGKSRVGRAGESRARREWERGEQRGEVVIGPFLGCGCICKLFFSLFFSNCWTDN